MSTNASSQKTIRQRYKKDKRMERISKKQFIELIKNGYKFNFLNVDKIAHKDYLRLISVILTDREGVAFQLSAINVIIHSEYYTYKNDNKDIIMSSFKYTRYYKHESYIVVDFTKMSSTVLISLNK